MSANSPDHPWQTATLRAIHDRDMRKASKPSIKQDQSDRNLLIREAGAINAEVNWYRSRQSLTIEVQAPKGFVWATCQERTLTSTTERSDGSWIRETVADMIEAMHAGFLSDSEAIHTDLCECDKCEFHDDEIEELDF